MRYEVKISSGMYGTKHHFIIESETFEELKNGILRRFGNLYGTNKAMIEKPRIKMKIKNAKSVDEILEKVDHSHWKFEIKELE